MATKTSSSSKTKQQQKPVRGMLTTFWNKSRYFRENGEMSSFSTLDKAECELLASGFIRSNLPLSFNPIDVASITFKYLGNGAIILSFGILNQKHLPSAAATVSSYEKHETSMLLFRYNTRNHLIFPKISIILSSMDCTHFNYEKGFHFRCGIVAVPCRKGPVRTPSEAFEKKYQTKNLTSGKCSLAGIGQDGRKSQSFYANFYYSKDSVNSSAKFDEFGQKIEYLDIHGIKTYYLDFIKTPEPVSKESESGTSGTSGTSAMELDDITDVSGAGSYICRYNTWDGEKNEERMLYNGETEKDLNNFCIGKVGDSIDICLEFSMSVKKLCLFFKKNGKSLLETRPVKVIEMEPDDADDADDDNNAQLNIDIETDDEDVDMAQNAPVVTARTRTVLGDPEPEGIVVDFARYHYYYVIECPKCGCDNCRGFEFVVDT